MTWPRRWSIPLLWLLAALLCGAIVLKTPVVADLTLFVPRDDPVAELLLEQLRSGPTTRLILIGLAGGSESDRAVASRALADRLRADHRFSRVANGDDTLPETELRTLFAQRYLLSPTVDPQRFSVDALRTALQQRLRELQSPLSVVQKRWLPADPTGEMLTLLRIWQGGLRAPAKRLGVWFAPNGDRALLLAETRASGYDLAAQRQVVTAIRAAFAAASAGTPIRLEMSGPGVLATLAEDTVRSEAEWLSVLAGLAMISILLLVYRSVRTVWLGALPMLAALLAGAATVGLLFGQLYALTFAFSMTVLGETLDYPSYLFSHRRAGETVTATLIQLWPTMRLCAATTLLGCLAMVTPAMPGLSQLGLFTMAGIVAAVATTRWLLPALTPADWRPPRPIGSGAWMDTLLIPRPRLALTIGGGALLILLMLALTAPPLWEDDIAALSPIPRPLLQLDQQLRADLGAPEVGQLIAITAPDAETALQRSETLARWLDARQAEGLLDGYDAAARYLPSQARQHQRQAQLPDPARLAENLQTAMAELPFKPDLFAPFLAAVAAARNAAPVQPDDWRGTLLGARIGLLLSPSAHGWTALLPLSGVRDPQALAAALPAADGSAIYLDLRAETSRLAADFRATALQRFAVGAALIVAVVWWGLRAWRAVAAALTPAVIALIFTVALLLGLGERLSLFHLVALLLVLGIGVDYGLFFSRPVADPLLRRHTLHALLVCCGSALTVFAMLSVSALPALHAIGLTVSLGVAASFIAALAAARPMIETMS
ncbi:MAG TPA: MMPL family transporter [Candidatus Competibacteraceae bacterium]|nr:MMPL family transporter [Candidatus Competibacteraceae bacterium]HQA26292.1 MMPL family transporter [Candidatus Competibacteraceae bacterium]HQD57139.1 MMPL family transporter [Candidatus Competibacteraceae bacterium]